MASIEAARQKAREKYDADKARFEERQRQMDLAASKVGNLRLNSNGSNTNNERKNSPSNQHTKQVQKHRKFIDEAKRQNKYTRFHHEKLVPEKIKENLYKVFVIIQLQQQDKQ